MSGGWNYRVVRKKKGEEVEYEIHEVYYHQDGSIRAWSRDAMRPYGQTLKSLTMDIKSMQHALDMDVIDEKDLPQ